MITKIDAVDGELLELVQAEIEELIAGSFLETSPIVAVSTRSGAGLDELRETLRAVGTNVPERSTRTITRLPIDRAFTMRGFGAVVTGTLVAGEIAEGAEMECCPQSFPFAVRGVQVHGTSVGRARLGSDAVNLGGVEAATIERVMVLAPAESLRTTQIVDAQVEVLASAPALCARGSGARASRHGGSVGAVAVSKRRARLSRASAARQFRFASPMWRCPTKDSSCDPIAVAHDCGRSRAHAHAVKHRGRERAEHARALRRLPARTMRGASRLC